MIGNWFDRNILFSELFSSGLSELTLRRTNSTVTPLKIL